MKKLIVEEKFNQKKLISFLRDKFPSASQNTFYKALRKKDIRLNGAKISENILLYAGDEVILFISDEFLKPLSFNFETIYEDKNIIIINKPKDIEVTRC